MGAAPSLVGETVGRRLRLELCQTKRVISFWWVLHYVGAEAIRDSPYGRRDDQVGRALVTTVGLRIRFVIAFVEVAFAMG